MKINNLNIIWVHINKQSVILIKKGLSTIWEAIKSCFGKGWWINHKEWDNKDGWSN